MEKAPAVLLILIMTVLISCEKLFIEKDQENTPENNFELLWNTLDRKYSFFEYKRVNWDSIYNIYRPEINNNLSDRQLFGILNDMLLELRDGHVNIYSSLNQSRNWEWFLEYPDNFNSGILERNYLGKDYITSGPFKTTVLDSIAYIYCGSFAEKINERDIDNLITLYAGLKGIIFDVRNNSGGFTVNGRMITGRFADRERLVSYTLYKNGPGHGDFSEPQSNFIRPEGKMQFLKPVVVLCNRKTYSAANDFVLSMSAFPNVMVVGDRTGGGGGTPYDYELLNGWRFRFPRTQTLRPDKFNVEEGIPPDVYSEISSEDENNGIDTIIETALNFIISDNLTE